MIEETEEKILQEVVVPLSNEEMKTLFSNRDQFRYIINYSKSSLKDSGFLFYISNLELPSEIDLNDEISTEDKLSLVRAYMDLGNLIDIGNLAYAVMEIIFTAKGIDTTDMFENSLLTEKEVQLFIEQNKETVQKWIVMLDSLYVFALYSIYAIAPEDNTPSTALNPIESMVPKITDPTYIGNNFVKVMQIPGFYELYFGHTVDLDHTYFFTHQFTEYGFQGKNLYYFFAKEDNWLLLSVLAILGVDLDEHTDDTAE